MAISPLDLAIEFSSTLERLDIRYILGGSMASSLVGEPRTTVDVDFAARLDSANLQHLLAEVADSYYVPTAAATEAVRTHTSFNLVHLSAALKIDLFVLGDNLLDNNQLDRRVHLEIRTDPRAQIWVTAPEDQILRKLDWYRKGGQVSDRQWRDIIAILRVQQISLDRDYLKQTARQVGLDDLLTSAQSAAITEEDSEG